MSELEEQAKGHDIYDVRAFLRSRLFASNGYKVVAGEGGGDVVEKRFARGAE